MDGKYITFPRSDGAWPRIIQMAEIAEKARTELRFAAVARLPFQSQENGLPAAGELHKVCDIEDKLGDALGELGFRHAGHVTGSGEMKVVFYGPRPAPASITVKLGLFKKVAVDLDSREDPDWQVFAMDLQASPVEYELGNNTMLLKKLDELGDVHTVSRPVDFTFLFPSESDRNAFLATVAPNGYRPTGDPTPEVNGNFWCEVAFETSIESDVIARHCAYVRDVAAKHGGEFDGWACHVTS